MAVELRRRGYDAVAVTERLELRQLLDTQILAAAVDERRAIVTEDIGGFSALHLQYLAAGKVHFGIVFTHPRRFHRKLHGSAALLRALDEWLDLHPEDDVLSNQMYWL